MKTPTQCALWTMPQLSNDPGFFEIVETFEDEVHFSRDLRRCRECGQLYIHDFYEEVNFSGGDDHQYACYVPVETAEEIESIRNVMAYELLHVYPHLLKYLSAGTMYWSTEPRT